ncbi:hypothetical protein HWV62_9361 [Athelia sp. TMB]|nr:hypothetical protein HWV62_9361 [Athelia sp. TMB]
MLSEEDLQRLTSASKAFLTQDDFGTVQVEDVMQDVFGDYAARSNSAEAVEWAKYWDTLAGYEETVRDNEMNAGLPPLFPGQLPPVIDVEESGSESETEDASTPAILKSLDQAAAAVREKERAERKANGNKIPQIKGRPGAPGVELLAKLVIEGTTRNKRGKEVKTYWCIGCDRSRMNNTRGRAYTHANECSSLQRNWPNEFREASDALYAMSSDAILSGNSAPPKVRGGKRKASTAGAGRESPLLNAFSSSSNLSQSASSSTTSATPPASTAPHAQTRTAPTMKQSSLKASFSVINPLSAIRQAEIDRLLLRLLVCCALSFALLDSMFFFDFCYSLCPAYSVPDRSHFISTHLAAEALAVSRQVATFLGAFIHLSLSFDGWSSKGHDEIYTVHITTPGRRSILVDGLILSGVSTTAENLFGLISEVIERFIASCFSLVVSDTTGNVKKLRRLIHEKWRWILNCPDPCHQLSLMMKDVMVGTKKYPKINGFAEPMKIVSALTTYFSHSNYGQHVLKDEMKFDSNNRGIQNAGATRFSSFALNAKSILRCLPTIQRCLESSALHFNTKVTAHLKKYVEYGTSESFTFQAQLFTIDALLSPIARGLKTLEGQNTTCSDVFSIYIGIAIGFTRVFQKPNDPIFVHRDKTYAVFNRRFRIFMADCTDDMFLLAYLLDPIFYCDGALRLNLPHRTNFSSKTVSPLVLRLISAARSMLQGEQLRMRSGGEAEGRILITQLERYIMVEVES